LDVGTDHLVGIMASLDRFVARITYTCSHQSTVSLHGKEVSCERGAGSVSPPARFLPPFAGLRHLYKGHGKGKIGADNSALK
jgi:hypothetical protein